MDQNINRKINELEQEVFDLQTKTEELEDNLKELTKLVNRVVTLMEVHLL
jgi:hypothetical protein